MVDRLKTLSFLVSAFCASFGPLADASDLTGVWSTDQAYCGEVFVKTGGKVSFAKDAFLKGGGFIIEGKEIRGPSAQCRIKVSRDEGAMTHMIAACATDIMLSDIQFSVETIDANTIARLFPGMPELEISYYRCSM